MVSWIWENIAAFLFVLTLLVFVHELGHYLVARFCGVGIDVFSIGFGPEIFGWTDRSGTRWKLSIIPLGGYVKMVGDANAASIPDDAVEALPPELKEKAFCYKPLLSRTLVVFAGPFANFLYAVVIFSCIFMYIGQPVTPPVIGDIQAGSAAEKAGFHKGDRVLIADGQTVERFEELQQIVRLKPDQTMTFAVERDGREVLLKAELKSVELDNSFGGKEKVGLLGLQATGLEFKKYPPIMSIWQGIRETYSVTRTMVVAMGQLVMGQRGSGDVGGPIKIAQLTNQVAQEGIVMLLWFSALLSINLGFLNLLPIPVLDGGHLFFYAIEGIIGRPLNKKWMDIFYRIGFALLISLMIYATVKDVLGLSFFKG
ncbi:MAG: RIP metalloprotease RseP [Alphaproteobacteria bacterium]|jgi:regulator of sigma E protease|nr:RIP metalloprotease RseP [Alphaproteobacteria bacterium]MBP9877477.1 RIP metalloprotease RseP [Alphaproteobacteria bacterium]